MKLFFHSSISLLVIFNLVTTGYGQVHGYSDVLTYEIGLTQQPEKHVDTISRGNKPDVTFINEKETRYLVLTFGDSTNNFQTDTSYLYRKISFENFHGRDAIVVSQRRYYSDTVKNSYTVAVMDRRDLSSLYSYRKDNTNGIAAFDFHENEIYGADSVQANTKRGKIVHGGVYSYLLETYFEILGSLPVENAGQMFAINLFSDGANDRAEYYLVSVEGKDDFKISDNLYACCWKLKLDYDRGYYDYLWISTKNHIVLKKESHSAVKEQINLEMPLIK